MTEQNPTPGSDGGPDGPGQVPLSGGGPGGRIGGAGQPGWPDEAAAGAHELPVPVEPFTQLGPDGRPLDPGFAAYDPALGPPQGATVPASTGRKVGGIIMIVLGALCLLGFLAGMANQGAGTRGMDSIALTSMLIGRILVAVVGVLLLVFGIKLVRPKRVR
ncbi:hypothetical protein [Galactobacter valiniphilus]|uniref:hypothetical protein n=1 Tax=Galactobacter valiniphilus TaxID=2676122 RepID=UPI003736030E